MLCLFNSRNFLKRSCLIIEKRRQKSNEEVEDENFMDTLKLKRRRKNVITKTILQKSLLKKSCSKYQRHS